MMDGENGQTPQQVPIKVHRDDIHRVAQISFRASDAPHTGPLGAFTTSSSTTYGSRKIFSNNVNCAKSDRNDSFSLIHDCL